MIPFGNQTVTMIRRCGDRYVKYILTGCSWRTKYGRTLYDNAMRSAKPECICRYTDGPKAEPGDVLILGRVCETITNAIEIPALMEKYRIRGAFICESFSDNSVGAVPMAHYCARGYAYGV